MKRSEFLSQGESWLYLPEEGNGPFPVVLYCHGWGGCRDIPDTLRPLRKALLAAGCAFASFTFEGSGKNGADLLPYITYTRLTEQLNGVIEALRARPEIDAARIGCFAVSSGTVPALRLASTPGKAPAFVVAVAACVSPQIDMPHGGAAKIVSEHLHDLAAGGRALLFGVPYGEAFLRDVLENAPMHTMHRVSCPVFFLQGGKDNAYRRADALLGTFLLQEAEKPVEYKELVNGGHVLNGAEDVCAEETLAWLRRVCILPEE